MKPLVLPKSPISLMNPMHHVGTKAKYILFSSIGVEALGGIHTSRVDLDEDHFLLVKGISKVFCHFTFDFQRFFKDFGSGTFDLQRYNDVSIGKTFDLQRFFKGFRLSGKISFRL